MWGFSCLPTSRTHTLWWPASSRWWCMKTSPWSSWTTWQMDWRCVCCSLTRPGLTWRRASLTTCSTWRSLAGAQSSLCFRPRRSHPVCLWVLICGQLDTSLGILESTIRHLFSFFPRYTEAWKSIKELFESSHLDEDFSLLLKGFVLSFVECMNGVRKFSLSYSLEILGDKLSWICPNVPWQQLGRELRLSSPLYFISGKLQTSFSPPQCLYDACVGSTLTGDSRPAHSARETTQRNTTLQPVHINRTLSSLIRILQTVNA